MPGPAAAIGIAPMLPMPPAGATPGAGAVASARDAAAAASASGAFDRHRPRPSRSDPADAQFPPPMLKRLAVLPDRPNAPPRPWTLVGWGPPRRNERKSRGPPVLELVAVWAALAASVAL